MAFSPSKAPAPARRGKALPLHLLYGNKEAEINEAKLELCRRLIPDPDSRRENVVEISPPTNYPLTCKSAFPQIAAELGQTSLFGDSCRVIVVNQLQELFGSWGGSRGKKAAAPKAPKTSKATAKTPAKTTRKKTAAGGESGASGAESSATTKSTATESEILQSFLDGLRNLLESTSNAIVFIAVEDDSKMRRVNDKSPLFEGLAALGTVRNFSAKSYRFELTDAIVSRSLPMAMQIVTTWRREDRRAAVPIFRGLLDDVHLLIQASILQREGAAVAADPEYGDLLFPADLKPNLQTVHSFRRGKYLGGVMNYPSVPHLLEALRGLLEIQNALYPTGDELYVPDVDYLIDVWLAKLLGR